MGEEELQKLLYRYNNNMATDEEKAIVESWYLQHHEEGDIAYTQDQQLEDAESIWASLNTGRRAKRTSLLVRIAAAASLLLPLAYGGYYILHHRKPVTRQIVRQQHNDIAPGGNKAILTLANGNKISITDARNGLLTQQGDARISKNKNGQIVYAVDKSEGGANQSLAYNTLSTPKGGQSAITLSDGTVAYLDAASSIKYPVVFNGNERRVEITGQVYFDVVHNAAKSFRVTVKGQTIEDIGTSFNVNAYNDEAVVRTTLLHGSVKIMRGKETATLTPGQQAASSPGNDHINVKDIDVEEATAWKNGYFMFDHENLESVMRKISRWYDVDITYPDGGNIREAYWGSITRYGNVSKVLNMLQVTGNVRFKIDGKKIIVLKK